MVMLKEELAKQYAELKTTSPLKFLRGRGWEKFETLGLPDKKLEAFRYLPLAQFYAEEVFNAAALKEPAFYSENIFPECEYSHLVFVDGIFIPHLSKMPKEIVVLPLEEAMGTYGNFLQNRFRISLEQEKDPFASLNAALHSKGVFIYIPPKLSLGQTIQCHHIFTAKTAARPRIHLFVGAHSEMDWITTVQKEGDGPSWVNSFIDIALDENASIRSTFLYNELDTKDWFFESIRGTLKRSSKLYAVSITTGAKSVRQDYHATLAGEGADATLQGIWILKNASQAHTHVVMDHASPHSRSMQLFKGVLHDSSQSSFEGKIYVRPEAQKTEAYQLNKHLLLGERALANSKPNLEVFADDVKASHGATTTQVDKKQLFYLKARGIPENIAKNLLILGFCKELIDQIPQEFARKKIHDLIQRALS